MTHEQLIELTRGALANQNIMQLIFNQIFKYDCNIKEEFKGDYNILPEMIYPCQIAGDVVISTVKMKTQRDGTDKYYSFLFFFTSQGIDIKISHPGSSNTDPLLFRDIFPAAAGMAAGQLGSDIVYLKETAVVGDITPSGWTERWQWISGEGKTTETDVSFSSEAGAGVSYSLKAA